MAVCSSIPSAGLVLFLAAIVRAQSTDPQTGPLRITLQEAQARAATAGRVAELANLNVKAARYHRLAAQADYFPKISAAFLNIHYNKFMGERIVLLRRTADLPLLNKDETLVAATAAQPITPLFQVREAVRIARADERIAQAKAAAAAAQVSRNVERNYLALLVAQRRSEASEIKIRMAETQIQTVSFSATDRQTALLDARKELVSASSEASELTRSLNELMGLPAETKLELDPPPAIAVQILPAQASQAAIDNSPEVIEAQQILAKARAASRLAKLEYVPTVAGVFGYTNQNVIPLLPRDFSFYGVVASWTVFDFGKRERTISERRTQVEMAELKLQLVRDEVASKIRKTSFDLDRSRRLLQLARQVISLYRAMPASYREISLETRAAWAQAEAEMFQAELEYRLADSERKRVTGGQ